MTTATPTDLTTSTPILEGREAAAHAIIKHYCYWAVGVGLVPVPIVDLIGIGGVQLKMISKISELYGIPFSEHTVTNILGALVGTSGGAVLARGIIGSILKTIPGVGAVVGALITGPVVAGAATYAVGKVFVHHFESGGNLLNLNPEKLRSYYQAQFAEGQKVAAEAKKAAGK